MGPEHIGEQLNRVLHTRIDLEPELVRSGYNSLMRTIVSKLSASESPFQKKLIETFFVDELLRLIKEGQSIESLISFAEERGEKILKVVFAPEKKGEATHHKMLRTKAQRGLDQCLQDAVKNRDLKEVNSLASFFEAFPELMTSFLNAYSSNKSFITLLAEAKAQDAAYWKRLKENISREKIASDSIISISEYENLDSFKFLFDAAETESGNAIAPHLHLIEILPLFLNKDGLRTFISEVHKRSGLRFILPTIFSHLIATGDLHILTDTFYERYKSGKEKKYQTELYKDFEANTEKYFGPYAEYIKVLMRSTGENELKEAGVDLRKMAQKSTDAGKERFEKKDLLGILHAGFVYEDSDFWWATQKLRLPYGKDVLFLLKEQNSPLYERFSQAALAAFPEVQDAPAYLFLGCLQHFYRDKSFAFNTVEEFFNGFLLSREHMGGAISCTLLLKDVLTVNPTIVTQLPPSARKYFIDNSYFDHWEQKKEIYRTILGSSFADLIENLQLADYEIKDILNKYRESITYAAERSKEDFLSKFLSISPKEFIEKCINQVYNPLQHPGFIDYLQQHLYDLYTLESYHRNTFDYILEKYKDIPAVFPAMLRDIIKEHPEWKPKDVFESYGSYFRDELLKTGPQVVSIDMIDALIQKDKTSGRKSILHQLEKRYKQQTTLQKKKDAKADKIRSYREAADKKNQNEIQTIIDNLRPSLVSELSKYTRDDEAAQEITEKLISKKHGSYYDNFGSRTKVESWFADIIANIEGVLHELVEEQVSNILLLNEGIRPGFVLGYLTKKRDSYNEWQNIYDLRVVLQNAPTLFEACISTLVMEFFHTMFQYETDDKKDRFLINFLKFESHKLQAGTQLSLPLGADLFEQQKKKEFLDFLLPDRDSDYYRGFSDDAMRLLLHTTPEVFIKDRSKMTRLLQSEISDEEIFATNPMAEWNNLIERVDSANHEYNPFESKKEKLKRLMKHIEKLEKNGQLDLRYLDLDSGMLIDAVQTFEFIDGIREQTFKRNYWISPDTKKELFKVLTEKAELIRDSYFEGTIISLIEELSEAAQIGLYALFANQSAIDEVNTLIIKDLPEEQKKQILGSYVKYKFTTEYRNRSLNKKNFSDFLLHDSSGIKTSYINKENLSQIRRYLVDELRYEPSHLSKVTDVSLYLETLLPKEVFDFLNEEFPLADKGTLEYVHIIQAIFAVGKKEKRQNFERVFYYETEPRESVKKTAFILHPISAAKSIDDTALNKYIAEPTTLSAVVGGLLASMGESSEKSSDVVEHILERLSVESHDILIRELRNRLESKKDNVKELFKFLLFYAPKHHLVDMYGPAIADDLDKPENRELVLKHIDDWLILLLDKDKTTRYSFEEMKTLIGLARELHKSQIKEIQRVRDQLIPLILKAKDPEAVYEKVMDVFIRNNLPLVGKVFQIFQILYPSEQISGRLSEHQRGSPVLQQAGGKRRYQVIFNDLLKVHLRSGNPSLKRFLSFLKEGDTLINKLEIGAEPLSNLEKDKLSALIKKYTTIQQYTSKANTSAPQEVMADDTDSLMNTIQKIREDIGCHKGETMSERITAMFLQPLGLKTVEEALNVMSEARLKADARGRSYMESGFEITPGDLLKGVNHRYLQNYLENGSVAVEYLGSDSGADYTPFDTDLAMVSDIERGKKYEEIIPYSQAAGYGKLLLCLKDQGKFQQTEPTTKISFGRHNKDTSKTTFKPHAYELFNTGFVGATHYGIRTGFALTDIDFMIVTDSLKEGKTIEEMCFSIAKNGYYIPIVDEHGSLVFSETNYDDLRRTFNGIEEYNGAPLPIATDQLGKWPQSPDAIKENKYDSKIDAEVYSEKIESAIKAILERNGIEVKNTFDESVLGAEIHNIGSSGRGTNLPNDSDFDFTIRLDPEDFSDKAYVIEGEIKNLLRSSIKAGGSVYSHSVGKEGNKMQIRSSQSTVLGEAVDIDIAIHAKSAISPFASHHSIEAKLASIEKQYGAITKQQVIDEIHQAKILLKGAGCYKMRGSSVQGIGGIGVENLILAHGGTVHSAFQAFYEAAHDEANNELPFETFIQNFKLLNAGVNFQTMEHDNFIGDYLNPSGYSAMLELIEQTYPEFKKR